MRAQYSHQFKEWPNFTWEEEKVNSKLVQVRDRKGRLLFRMGRLGFPISNEILLDTLIADVIKSSEIEGETLSRIQVKSSIAKSLGLHIEGPVLRGSRIVDGMVGLIMDATGKYNDQLTKERLFDWHKSLFPDSCNTDKFRVGNWRKNALDDPMQVVSGIMGGETVHFVAPDSGRLDTEMDRFLEWFNGQQEMDPILKAAVAHLWFVTIHPFDDGNGRIARAIADMLLARSDGILQCYYSMSAQIMLERKSYYDNLEKTQKSLDITDWMIWFLSCLGGSLDAAEKTVSDIIKKVMVMEHPETKTLNVNQRKVLFKLLDGFEGKLTDSKFRKLANCSTDLAMKDLHDMVQKGVLLEESCCGAKEKKFYSLNTKYYEESKLGFQ